MDPSGRILGGMIVTPSEELFLGLSSILVATKQKNLCVAFSRIEVLRSKSFPNNATNQPAARGRTFFHTRRQV